jgi:hypothetical protein
MQLYPLTLPVLALSTCSMMICGQLPQTANFSSSGTMKRSDSDTKPRIVLRVYDLADVDTAIMASAKKVTAEIFRKAGVDTVWLDCSVDQSDCGSEAERPQFKLQLPSRATVSNSNGPLGFAMPCAHDKDACVFYIFYSRITAIAAVHGVRPGQILGHVMAHEIGHTLLGPDAHDLCGIMQSRLPVGDMERTLYFTPAQSNRLVTELSARQQATNRHSERRTQN